MASPMSAAAPNLSASSKIHTALSKIIQQRCLELTEVIENSSAKELHPTFPTLVDHIFGFSNQPGWGLNRITKTSNNFDYNIIRQFLSPSGAMMQLVSKLQSDDSAIFRYEFPISCLPYPTRCSLQERTIPPLYVNKLQFSTNGNPLNQLYLDAFEYYIFHLAYVLVNPVFTKNTLVNSQADLLYFRIVEDYLGNFLPLEGKPLSTDLNMPSTPLHNPVKHNTSIHSPARLSPSKSTMNFNRGQQSLLRSQAQYQWRTASPHSTPSIAEQKDNETWRSELLVQILVEFWLNQSSLELDTPKIGRHSSENFMPTVDHVQVARILVKHLHYFSNSAKDDMVVSPYSQPMINPVDEFKRNVIPNMVQSKLYCFLKHGFQKWPLDTSFRMMLEMWLSYIQPWRYTDVSQAYLNKENIERSRKIDDKWSVIISENLLFYTGLFQEFLPRLFRLDLSSPKNAYMLFRVTKVLSTSKLAELICEAEKQLEPQKQRRIPDLGGSYIGMNSTMSALYYPAEIEGSAYEYKYMFGEETIDMILKLLQLIVHAKSTADNIQRASDDGNSSFLSLLGLGTLADYNVQRYSSFLGDDYSPSDSRRVESHLDHSAKNLCSIFGLDLSTSISHSNIDSENKSNYLVTSALPPDHLDTDRGPQLTPLGRFQLMNGLRRFEVSYRGDSELHPIRNAESTILIRMLYHLSSFLNHQYGIHLERAYHRQDMIGGIFKEILLPPMMNMSPRGIKPSSPRLPQTPQQKQLVQRPRISLRFLGNYYNIAYLIVGYFIIRSWLGCGPVVFTFLLMAVLVLFAFIKSYVCPAVCEAGTPRD